MSVNRRWTVHLAAAAVDEYFNIIEWTGLHFGERQARAYQDVLDAAIDALGEGPAVAGARLRDSALGLRTLHVSRKGRKGRHVVLFREDLTEPYSIVVLRILHDAMDLERHYSSDEGTQED